MIVCENGHEICWVVQMIRMGDELRPEFFGQPRAGQSPVAQGRAIAPCQCGARYWRSDTGSLHTDRGWVPRCD